MATLKKSRLNDLSSRVEKVILAHVGPEDRVVVGLSGGLDSVVLFDIIAVLAARNTFNLSAVHVNHQLSANAARWAQFVQNFCAA